MVAIIEEARAYVAKCRSLGFSTTEIRTALEKAGYPPPVVIEVLGEDHSAEQVRSTSSPPHYEVEIEHHPALATESRTTLPEGLIARLWMLTTRPRSFFLLLEGETVPYRALSQYLFLSGAFSLFWFALAMVFGPSVVGEDQPSLLLNLVVLVFVIGFYPVIALIWHFAVMIFSPAQGAGSSLEICTYSVMPAIILSWVPGVNILLFVYAWILQYHGLRNLQKLGKISSALLVLLLAALTAAAGQGIRIAVQLIIAPLIY